jgi:hypothetical protein
MSHANAPQKLFKPLLVMVLVLLSLFSLSAFMALSAFAPDLRSKSNGGNHAWSRSAVGFAGFVRMLQETNHTVLRSREDAEGNRPEHDLTVLTPKIGQDAEAIWAARTGPALVILPKWRVARDPQNPQWVLGLGLQNPDLVQELAEDLVEDRQEEEEIYFALQINRVRSAKPDTEAVEEVKPARKRSGKLPKADLVEAETKSDPEPLEDTFLDPIENWQTDERFGEQDFALGQVENLQTMQFEGLVPMIWSGKQILLGKLPDQELYILSDPDLMNTLGLHDFQNLRAGIQVIEGLNGSLGTTLFDMTLHGFKQNINLLKTLLMPPFLAAMLCALATAALMAWAAWNRFGPVREPEAAHALGKQVLVENSAALIKLANREAGMVAGFAQLTRNLAAKAIGAPKGLTNEQLNSLLVRVGKNANIETDILALLAKAKSSDLRPNEILAIPSQIYHWRGEISGEHRKR